MADTYANKSFRIALALFALFLAGYAFLQSPIFSLREVRLSGNDHLTLDDVIAQAGLVMGTNLLEVDPRRVARSLEQSPVIAQVRVARRFPATLLIQITERRPVAYLPAERGFWTVDAEGRILYRVETLNKPMPLLTTSPPVAPAEGHVLDEPHVLAALRFVSALSLRGLAQLAEVHAAARGIRAYTADGITVDLGLEGDMKEKAGVLETLLAKAAEGNVRITRIDVRHPRSPVVEGR